MFYNLSIKKLKNILYASTQIRYTSQLSSQTSVDSCVVAYSRRRVCSVRSRMWSNCSATRKRKNELQLLESRSLKYWQKEREQARERKWKRNWIEVAIKIDCRDCSHSWDMSRQLPRPAKLGSLRDSSGNSQHQLRLFGANESILLSRLHRLSVYYNRSRSLSVLCKDDQRRIAWGNMKCHGNFK